MKNPTKINKGTTTLLIIGIMTLMMLYALLSRAKAIFLFERCKSTISSSSTRRRKRAKRKSNMLNSIDVCHAEAAQGSSYWLLDTGASVSITNSDEGVKNITQTNLGLLGFLAAMTQTATRTGFKTIELKTRHGDSISVEMEVLIVENTRKKILSWTALKAKGWMLKSAAKDTYLRSPRVPGEAFRYVPVYTRGNVLYIKEEEIGAEIFATTTKTQVREAKQAQLWHNRLGHLGKEPLRQIHETTDHGSQMSRVKWDQAVNHLYDSCSCNACRKANVKAKKKKALPNRAATRPGEVTHIDPSGHIETPAYLRETSLGKAPHTFTVFTDEFTRFKRVKVLTNKPDWLRALKDYVVYTGWKLREIFQDYGTELNSNAVKAYCKDENIVISNSPAGEPDSNGIAESAIRQTKLVATRIMEQASCPEPMWGYAVMFAEAIMNASYHKAIKTTPFQKATGTKPTVSHFKVPFCLAIVHRLGTEAAPFPKTKGVECIFIAYSANSRLGHKGGKYWGWDWKSDKYFEFSGERATFYEDVFPFGEMLKQGAHMDERVAKKFVKWHNGRTFSYNDDTSMYRILYDDGDKEELSIEETTDAREHFRLAKKAGTEAAKAAKELRDHNVLHTTLDDEDRDPAQGLGGHHSNIWEEINSLENLSTAILPKNWEQAMQMDAKGWTAALEKESAKFAEFEVFTPVVNPTREQKRDAMSAREVYTIKNGLPAYRVTVRGDQEREKPLNIQAPIVRHSTLRLLLAKAAKYDYEVVHMDITGAFLQSTPFPSTAPPKYMWLPRSMGGGMVRLNKALYGLGEASHEWRTTYVDYLLSIGFVMAIYDPCLLIYRKGDLEILFPICVDDSLFITNRMDDAKAVLDQILQRFKGRVEGIPGKFLGTNYAMHLGLYETNQAEYIDSVLKNYDLQDLKPVSTPQVQGQILSKQIDQLTIEDQNRVNSFDFRGLLGSAIWLLVTCRPEIATAVSDIAKHTSKVGIPHIKALTHLWRYLKSTKHLGLKLWDAERAKTRPGLQVYTDSSFAEQDDALSRGGWIVFYDGTPIDWKSSITKGVSTSTGEAEYKMLLPSALEAIHYKFLCNEIGLKVDGAVPIWTDSTVATTIANAPYVTIKGRQFKVAYHRIREEVQAKSVTVKHVPGVNNLADVLTKSTTKAVLDYFTTSAMIMTHWKKG